MTVVTYRRAPANTLAYQGISRSANFSHSAYRQRGAHGKAWGATSSWRLVPQAFRGRKVTTPAASSPPRH
jgi:hypothetical protein